MIVFRDLGFVFELCKLKYWHAYFQLLENHIKSEVIEKNQLVHALPTCDENKPPLSEPRTSASVACGSTVFEVSMKVPTWASQVFYFFLWLVYRWFVRLFLFGSIPFAFFGDFNHVKFLDEANLAVEDDAFYLQFNQHGLLFAGFVCRINDFERLDREIFCFFQILYS